MAAADYIQEAKFLDIVNFKHDNRRVVGHLESFEVGGEALKPDFQFIDPTNPSSKIPAVGGLIFGQWDKKSGGILVNECYISAANQGIAQDGIGSHDKTAKFKAKFTWYKYDYATETYYKCFHTDGQVIEGQISEEGNTSVSDELNPDYKQIATHKFIIHMVGSDKLDQLLHIAYDTERKKTYPFGQKAKGG